MFHPASVCHILIALMVPCLPACASRQGETEGVLVHVTPEQDAAVLSALEGHWVAETPAGAIELDVCDSGQDAVDVDMLWPFEPCVEVAHFVHGDGRAAEQDVAIGSVTRQWDDFFTGQHSQVCQRVLVAPLKVQVRSWCEPAVYDGAARLDAVPDPYLPPYALSFAYDNGGPGWVQWQGRYRSADLAEIEFAPGVQCPTHLCSDPHANPNDCIPDDAGAPVTTTVPLRRTGPTDCSAF